MKCPKCNETNHPNGAKFCYKCGSALINVNEDAESLFAKGKALMKSPENYKEAVEYFKQSAAMANHKAQNWLAACYLYGWGVEKDLAKSFDYRMKAALNGNSQAQYIVGVEYLDVNSNLVKPNKQTGYNWILKSANAEDAGGITYLGYCYYHGYGVAKDEKKAHELILKGAKKGATMGKRFLTDYFGETI